MRKPDYQKAIDAALEIINELSFFDPPIDPIQICEQKAIDVLFADFSRYKEISGFFDAKNNTIYVNQVEKPARQIFTVAHELGHKILHKDWAETNNYKVLLREELEFPSKEPHEQEANTFAKNLLVPKHMLKKYKDIASIDELARLFMVSTSVIRNRLSDLL